MSGIEDVFKGGNLATGLAIGIGAGVIAPLVLPLLRPMAKAALKAGLAAYDQGRVMLSEVGEQMEDVLAEARAEMDMETREATSGAGARPHKTTDEGGRASA